MLRALDLFCGAGGAGMGLHRAGYDVLGIDIKPQPRYPFRFVQGDVMAVLDDLSKGNILGNFEPDLIWASPPCQHYTQMLNHGQTDRSKHPDLIPEVRRLLTWINVPWVIENVGGSPLCSPIMLCGEMFALRVMRHRFFEASVGLLAPPHPRHNPAGAIRKQGDGGHYYRVYGHETGKAEWGAAMGIDWMKSPELAQAIPPAYSEYIANQFKETT